MALKDTYLQVIQNIRLNKVTPISMNSADEVKNLEELIAQIDTEAFVVWVKGKKKYKRSKINEAIEDIFEKNEWHPEGPVDKHDGHVGFVDFRKDHIAVEVQFGPLVPNDLGKFQTLYKDGDGEIDCCILVLPMPAFRKHIFNAAIDLLTFSRQIETIGGIDDLSFDESEIPHNFKVPLFIFGISTPEIEKEEKHEREKHERETPSPAKKERPHITIPPLPQSRETNTSLRIIPPPLSYNLEAITVLPDRIQNKLREVQLLIEQVDALLCNNNREEINNELAKIFEKYGWENEKKVDEAIIDYEKSIGREERVGGFFDERRVDHFGYRIGIEVQFDVNIAEDLSKMQRLFVNKVIDCGILVLATPAFAADIKASADLNTFLFYMNTFVGLAQSGTPHTFTLPLLVFVISTQEVQDRLPVNQAVMLPNQPLSVPPQTSSTGPLPRQTGVLPTVTPTSIEALPGQTPSQPGYNVTPLLQQTNVLPTVAPPLTGVQATSQLDQVTTPLPQQITVLPTPSPTNANPSRMGTVTSKVVLSVALAILLILGSLGLFAFNAHQIAVNKANATATTLANNTATAQAAQATNQANTATAQAIAAQETAQAIAAQETAQAIAAQETAQAQMNATATAVTNAQNPDPYSGVYGTLAIYDPLSDNSRGYGWDEGSNCSFTNGAYYVSQSVKGYYLPCTANNVNISEFVFEVQMTLLQGNCGGIDFTNEQSGNYTFQVCADGSFRFYSISNNGPQVNTNGQSSAIITALGQSNILAVVPDQLSLDLYVNHALILKIIDFAPPMGKLTLIAVDYNNATTVAYTNAKVWTS